MAIILLLVGIFSALFPEQDNPGPRCHNRWGISFGLIIQRIFTKWLRCSPLWKNARTATKRSKMNLLSAFIAGGKWFISPNRMKNSQQKRMRIWRTKFRLRMSHNKKKKGKRVDDATKEGIKNVENHHLDADCVLIGRLCAIATSGWSCNCLCYILANDLNWNGCWSFVY